MPGGQAAIDDLKLPGPLVILELAIIKRNDDEGARQLRPMTASVVGDGDDGLGPSQMRSQSLGPPPPFQSVSTPSTVSFESQPPGRPFFLQMAQEEQEIMPNIVEIVPPVYVPAPPLDMHATTTTTTTMATMDFSAGFNEMPFGMLQHHPFVDDYSIAPQYQMQQEPPPPMMPEWQFQVDNSNQFPPPPPPPHPQQLQGLPVTLTHFPQPLPTRVPTQRQDDPYQAHGLHHHNGYQ
jgi:hypothetical protein